MLSENTRFWLLALPGVAFLLVFLVLPLASIVVFSFWRTESYELIREWNLDNYRTLTEGTYLTFLGRSLAMATAVSAVALVYAWPVAMYIARYGGRHRLLLLLLTSAPFLTGEILRITALQQILGPAGVHTRTSVGVYQLPKNATVELDLIASAR